MEVLLITNHNSYVGREYVLELDKAKINYDMAIIGEYPAHNEIEDKRCAGLWFPPEINLSQNNVYRFKSLKVEDFLNFLSQKKYDLAIQGGTGILRQNVIEKFKFGILNFHPGDLPQYRGCMAPEWQVFEDRKVVSTCHLVDEGIDTGDIVAKKELNLDYSNYNKMRAGIYPETSKFVVEIINKISKDGFVKAVKQDETNAQYRKVMSDEILEKVVEKMRRTKNEVL